MLDKEANTETIIADGQRETSFWFFSLNTYYMCPKCDFFLISLLWVGFLLAATKSPDEYRCRDQCNLKFLSSYTLYHFRYHKKSPIEEKTEKNSTTQTLQAPEPELDSFVPALNPVPPSLLQAKRRQAESMYKIKQHKTWQSVWWWEILNEAAFVCQENWWFLE